MSDVFERLTAANPYARDSYQVNDVGALITRVTTTAPRERSVWRRFQLGVSSAVGATTLVTASLIAVLQGIGGSLPVLSIAAPAPSVMATNSRATSQSPVYASAVKALTPPVHFVAGPTLSTTPARANAYQLTAPSSPRAEAARLASVFHLAGALVVNASKTIYQVRQAPSVFTYVASGLPSWRYARASSTQPLPGALALSTVALKSRARELVGQLNYGYQVASPTLSFANQPTSVVSVHFPLTLGGLATPLSITFTYAANGALVAATGPSFFVARSYNYPLASARSGVTTLNAAAHASLLTSGGSANGAPSQRTLRRVTLSLGAYQLRDGSFWLIPLYTYFEAPHQQSPSWSLIALTPRYLRHATVATTSSVQP